MTGGVVTIEGYADVFPLEDITSLNLVTDEADLEVNGGHLILRDPVGSGFNVTIGDGLIVRLGLLDINAGAHVFASDLRLGETAVGESGEVRIFNGGSLEVTSITSNSIGLNGASGMLTIDQGTVTLAGSTKLGVSVANGSTGFVSVANSSTLTLDDLSLGGSVAGATGTLTLSDNGLAQQTGASTLTVGGSAGAGVINVQDSATFDSGTGSITINSPGQINVSGGTFQADGLLDLQGEINVTGGTFQADGLLDLQGEINVTGGTFQADGLLDLQGEINVSGGKFQADAFLDFQGGTFNLSGGELQINNGIDAVTNGGAFVFTGGTIRVAHSQTVTLPTLLNYGGTSLAQFKVTNHALVSFQDDLIVAEQAGSNGTMLIEKGGRVESGGDIILAAQPTSNAEVTVQGRNCGNFFCLAAGSLQSGGGLYIGGNSSTAGGTATLNIIEREAEVVVAGEMVLYAGGTVNVLSTSSFHPRLEVGKLARNFGEINATRATLDFLGGLNNAGQLNLDSTDVNGNVHNSETIDLNIINTFTGNVSGSGNYTGGGIAEFQATLAHGDSAAEVSFGGDVRFTNSSLLEIELGGTTPGTEHDKLSITGTATLGATLDVLLIDAFEVSITSGDQFVILDAGTLTGAFTNIAPGGRLTVENFGGNIQVDYGATSPFDPNQVVLSDFLFTATVATWVGGGANQWTTAANWDINKDPDNEPPVLYNAIVPGGTAAAIVSASIEIEALTITGGTVQSDDTLTVNSGFTWNDGTISGSGSVVVNGAGTINATGFIHLAGNLTNTGTLNWQSGQLRNNGTLRNQGTWNITGENNLSTHSGLTFINEALASITSSNTNFVTLDGRLENDGTVEITGGGTLRIPDHAGDGSDGDFLVTDGRLEFRSNFAQNHTVRGSISGEEVAFIADTATIEGSYNVMTTEVSGPTLAIFATPAPAVTTVLNISGGTLRANGTVQTDTLDWTGGTISGSGSVVVNASGTINAASSVSLSGSLTNAGTLDWQDGNLNGTGTLRNQATWNITGSGNLDTQSGLTLINEAGATVTNSNTALVTVGAPTQNAGDIESLAGTLRFGAFTQTGGAIRVVGAVIGATQTMVLQGGRVEGDGTFDADINISNTVGDAVLAPRPSHQNLSKTRAFRENWCPRRLLFASASNWISKCLASAA